MANRSRKRRFPWALLAIFMILLTAVVYISNTALQVTHFTAAYADLPDGFDGARIAVLSDLHGAKFGENNADLFAAVAEQKPDYIFVAGDLIDEETADTLTYAAETAAGLAEIAPVYYVTGNHEWAAGDVPTLKKTLSAAGCTVLSNQYVTLERNGSSAVLAGIDDPNGYADQKSPETLAAELYADLGDPFWLLLAHRNDLFSSRYSLLGADLVLSGHGHGGVIRLPFTDGLLGTQHNLFPTHTAGLYENNRLFVSRGLGNVGITIRFMNRPEVAILTLRKG